MGFKLKVCLMIMLPAVAVGVAVLLPTLWKKEAVEKNEEKEKKAKPENEKKTAEADKEKKKGTETAKAKKNTSDNAVRRSVSIDSDLGTIPEEDEELADFFPDDYFPDEPMNIFRPISDDEENAWAVPYQFDE